MERAGAVSPLQYGGQCGLQARLIFIDESIETIAKINWNCGTKGATIRGHGNFAVHPRSYDNAKETGCFE
jgi:hypothetical protein